jgi:DNA modification methylase
VIVITTTDPARDNKTLSKQSVSNTDQDLPQDCARRGNKIAGLKEKDLVGIPWRVAFALQADGWYLRQDIIWHKPNPMPESVRDRCTKSHEYIFLLSKNPKYYYDNEAIKEDAKSAGKKSDGFKGRQGGAEYHATGGGIGSEEKIYNKKNKRSVWTITTKPYKEAHFATFPTDLIEPCVLAGCPEKVCVQCSEPYKLKVDIKRTPRWELSPNDPRYRPSKYENAHDSLNGNTRHSVTETKPLGLEKQCDCETNETKGGTVLDPFGGSGTTGLVASKHNRNAVLCELNEGYIDLAEKRLNDGFDIFSSDGLEII